MRFDAEQLRDRALTRLETLVMAESPSGEPELLRIVNADLEQAYRALGARVTRERGPDGDHLVCEWPGTAPDDAHILLIGHSDTVLPVGTTVERPFTLHEDGDTVTGPGVYDMKGSLVAIELAFVLLREQGLSPSRPVRLVVVNDEEIGSPDGRRIIAAHAEGAFAALGFEPPLPGGTLKTGRRGVARVRIDVQGVEAHAGLDASLGTSAIDELIDQIAVVRGAVPAPPAAEFNIGTISGGTRANVVAGTAWAEIGLRFATPAAEAAVLGALDSLTPVRPDAKLTVTRLSYRPAWERDPANPLAARLAALAAERGTDLLTGTSGGAGDTNLTGSLGIPTADGLGPDGAGAHSMSERASVASLLDRAALLAAYLIAPEESA
ncbi:M20/M25/M40 family metallo-hydrolase [Streptomyces sp. NBC_01527]|uniref:M20/M25/M40 family metallo-hydrolase n=1 Tax=unclassified Streptomyces TaxID=2593676 RepID=UPI002E104BB2|nr:M20/M25/M40 family metallo-hydrolase [Streptomyces sp. NBC_01230]